VWRGWNGFEGHGDGVAVHLMGVVVDAGHMWVGGGLLGGLVVVRWCA
jgi:hypothetical protein